MPFALTGFFLAVKYAGNPFEWKILILIILCMVFARNAAMAFNRYIDREIDTRNPRTALREIPLGLVRPSSALHFTWINALLFIATTFFINQITLRLSPVALLLILGYSFTKKFTSLSHFILGLSLSLAPIGAYLAVTGEFDFIPLLFSLIVIFWVSGFDIIYALQDHEFDKTEKLKSIPVLFGKKNSILISIILHIIVAIIVIYIGVYLHAGISYWSGSILFTGLLLYQHILVKPHDLSKINIAFFTTNGIASIIYAFFTIFELY